jgi:glycosyltransferase involved in cell wall biosynthesis
VTAALPRVTFGVIVLNGEPFTRYCLRALYPFAHEIIVVEGGHEDTRAVSTADGHSTDGTLEVVRRFMAEEDPEHKVQLVTTDGFWVKQDERGGNRTHQSRAYAERATGDYLWQVDIDEFYRPEDMRLVLEMLAREPDITAVSFDVLHFWAGLDYRMDGWRWRREALTVHRLFKWRPGYTYVTHEPPIVHDEHGRSLRRLRWVDGHTMASRGVYMYHYPCLFPRQVREKAQIYRDERPDLSPEAVQWAETSYFRLERPFRVDRHYWYPSWLERYAGEHPPQVRAMMADVRAGVVHEELRPCDDAERLLASRRYRVGRALVRWFDYVDRARLWAKRQWARARNAPHKVRGLVSRSGGG